MSYLSGDAARIEAKFSAVLDPGDEGSKELVEHVIRGCNREGKE